MKIVLAVACLALLTACNRQQSEAQRVVQIADPQVEQLRSDLQAMKAEHDQLKGELDTVRRLALASSNDLESLRKTVNHNADSANGNALRRMTADGVCGQESYLDSNNVTRLRNRTCTEADFRRGN